MVKFKTACLKFNVQALYGHRRKRAEYLQKKIRILVYIHTLIAQIELTHSSHKNVSLAPSTSFCNYC